MNFYMTDSGKEYQHYFSCLMIAILLVRSLSIAVLAKGLIDFHLLASSRVRPQPLHQPFFPENWQISIHGLFLRFIIKFPVSISIKGFYAFISQFSQSSFSFTRIIVGLLVDKAFLNAFINISALSA